MPATALTPVTSSRDRNTTRRARGRTATLRAVTRELSVYREAEIRAALDMASLIDAVERAFVAYSNGDAELPNVIHLDVPESRGEIHVKAGHLHGAGHYAVKVASGFYAADPPAIDGVVLAFDARDGSPSALLLDNGAITDLRTGAAGGVAARRLAPEVVDRVAVIGTGSQARYQLDALAAVRSFSSVVVWGRNRDRAARCVADLLERPGLPDGATYEVADSAEAAARGSDVVITCTASDHPLVEASWLAPGAHVTAVGSDGPGKQELDAEILREADVVACDSRTQCGRLGELQHAPDVLERAVELGEIAAGAASGRTDSTGRTVCDLTGVGVQDVAAAALVLERGSASARLER
jgi:ornithine cyclodeaminase/alanine dehydrogenase-like protein (mu-crystallin family)